MSIENPTLAHFRHFSPLFTNFPSTAVENSLQISSFLTNKPNSPHGQMNFSIALIKDYKNLWLYKSLKNKPNSNPIKANNKLIWTISKPKQSQYKPEQTQSQTSLVLDKPARKSRSLKRQELVFTLLCVIILILQPILKM